MINVPTNPVQLPSQFQNIDKSIENLRNLNIPGVTSNSINLPIAGDLANSLTKKFTTDIKNKLADLTQEGIKNFLNLDSNCEENSEQIKDLTTNAKAKNVQTTDISLYQQTLNYIKKTFLKILNEEINGIENDVINDDIGGSIGSKATNSIKGFFNVSDKDINTYLKSAFKDTSGNADFDKIGDFVTNQFSLSTQKANISKLIQSSQEQFFKEEKDVATAKQTKKANVQLSFLDSVLNAFGLSTSSLNDASEENKDVDEKTALKELCDINNKLSKVQDNATQTEKQMKDSILPKIFNNLPLDDISRIASSTGYQLPTNTQILQGNNFDKIFEVANSISKNIDDAKEYLEGI